MIYLILNLFLTILIIIFITTTLLMNDVAVAIEPKVAEKKPKQWKPYNIKLVASQQLLKKKKKLKDNDVVIPESVEIKIDSLNVFDDTREYSNWKKLTDDLKKEKLTAYLGAEHPKLQEVINHVDNKTLPKVTYDKINGRIKNIEGYPVVATVISLDPLKAKVGGAPKKKGGKKVPSLFKKI